MKIAIGIPSLGTVKTLTTASLMTLHTKMFLDKMNPQIIYAFGMVNDARNMIIELALKLDCTHLLFIDTDATFNYDAAMVLEKEDKNIIGCNAAKKQTGSPVITQNANGEPLSCDVDEIDRIGMHVTLIKTDVFRNMEKPWFNTEAVPGQSVLRSGDFVFCKNARKAGYKIYCQNELSKTIGHIDGRERVLYIGDKNV